MVKLNLNSPDNNVVAEIRSRLNNVYSRLAGDDDYRRNQGKLGLIQFCVITTSAVATGATNAFAHRERLTDVGAIILALLISGFVEVFYFTLRQGLSTIYKGMQRVAAEICYRTIQLTMILNGAVICVWVSGFKMPALLATWNRWSIAVHFALALVGVSAVRDSDPVVANKILELKAETAKQDIVTLRKATALGNPVVLFAAKFRGMLDGFKLARQIISDKSGQIISDDPEKSADYDITFNALGGRENLLLPGAQAETGIVTDLGKHRSR
jgi:hypothetical protein